MPIRQWTDKLTRYEESKLFSAVTSKLLDRILDESLRTDLSTLVESSNYEGLLRYDLSYSRGYSVSDVISARQLLALYQKNDSLPVNIDTRQVAISKWVAAERSCRLTNEIFQRHARGEFQFPPDVESILHGAQRKIARVLGDLPSLAELKLRFGPGATTTLTKRNASPRYKLGGKLSCSDDLLPNLIEVLEEMPAWFDSPELDLIEIGLEPSRLEFVPKNAKTDRAIAVEPVLNQMVQLGIGDIIAYRLRVKAGIDIRDQTPNQRMAREGSISGDLATLDLSSASDLISRELVFHLLPIDWALFLDSARSGRIEFEGMQISLEKFCSMGNGFTFPLETLLFWSIASSCTNSLGLPSESVRVYGDDIIVPSGAYAYTVRVLVACGFEVNTSKSYADGPFRESCGKDYYFGIDVRPVYIKSSWTGCDLFRAHNWFKRLFDDDLAAIFLSFIPDPLRIWGPDGFGDGHLIGGPPPKPHRRLEGWSGYTFDTFTLKSRKSFRATPGDFVYPSYSVYISEGRSETPHPVRGDAFGVSLPGSRGYKRISIYTLDPS